MILNGSVNGWYLEFDKHERRKVNVVASELGRPPREVIMAIIQNGFDVSDKDAIQKTIETTS